MMIAEMNTHAVFKNLIKHGFNEVQAEGITEAIASSTPSSENFVRKELFETQEKEIHDIKSDIMEMKRDIQETKVDIAIIKHEIASMKDTMATKSELNELRMATKADINELRIATKADINELRMEMKADISELRTEMKADINEFRIEMATSMSEIKHDILKWIIPLVITVIVCTMGMIVPMFIQYFS